MRPDPGSEAAERANPGRAACHLTSRQDDRPGERMTEGKRESERHGGAGGRGASEEERCLAETEQSEPGADSAAVRTGERLRRQRGGERRSSRSGQSAEQSGSERREGERRSCMIGSERHDWGGAEQQDGHETDQESEAGRRGASGVLRHRPRPWVSGGYPRRRSPGGQIREWVSGNFRPNCQ